MTYLLIPFLLSGTIFLYYIMRKLKYWKNLNVQFVRPLPLFGNLKDILLMKQNVGDFCKSVYDETAGPFKGFFFFHDPCLLLTDLDMIKCVLIKDFDIFMDRAVVNNEIHDSIGSNLLFLMKSPKWNAMKKKLTPLFSPKRMKATSELLKICGQDMVEYIKKKCSQNKKLDAKIISAKYVVDSVTSSFYGLEGNCFKDDNSPFNALSSEVFNWKHTWQAMRICAYFIAPALVKLFHMKFVDTATGNFFRNLFWDTIWLREKKKLFRDDAIDLLIKYRNPNQADETEYLDGDVLIAQAFNFFAAGVETSSTTLTYGLMEIAMNSEVQNKLRKEIIKVTEEHGSLTYESIQKMDYLDKVISETMRKYPILPFLDRRCSREYTLPGSSLTLQKGIVVYISILGIHYNEKFYPDPYRFDPDRFDKENVDQRHSMAYLPFGDGPRACLGRRFGVLSMAFALAYILSNFEVRLRDETKAKTFSWNHKGITLQPDEGTDLDFFKL